MFRFLKYLNFQAWIALQIILIVVIGCNEKTIIEDPRKAGLKLVNISCVKGEVIRATCNEHIIQVLNNDNLGEDGWSDGSGNIYDNVFDVYNLCDIPGFGNQTVFHPGDTVYFSLSDVEINNNCMICLMAPQYPGPSTKYIIKNYSKSKCQ